MLHKRLFVPHIFGHQARRVREELVAKMVSDGAALVDLVPRCDLDLELFRYGFDGKPGIVQRLFERTCGCRATDFAKASVSHQLRQVLRHVLRGGGPLCGALEQRSARFRHGCRTSARCGGPVFPLRSRATGGSGCLRMCRCRARVHARRPRSRLRPEATTIARPLSSDDNSGHNLQHRSRHLNPLRHFNISSPRDEPCRPVEPTRLSCLL